MGNNFGLRGLGPKTAAKLERLGIHDCPGLLRHYPSRYLDFTHHMAVSDVVPDSAATVTGRIIDFQNIYIKSRKNLQKAVLQDHSGRLDLIWFNQPYLSKTILVGETYTFAGTVSSYRGRPTLMAPLHLNKAVSPIIPVYPETNGLTSAWFRQVIPSVLSSLLTGITDPLPSKIRQKYRLIELSSALKTIHSPSNFDELKEAIKRLSLEEILSLQARSFLNKEAWAHKTPPRVFVSTPRVDAHITKFIRSLPFNLTPSQTKAWVDIRQDLLSSRPANRLLQGEVGSGKTVLAVLSCLLAYHNRSTSLVIAPTEILARQHFATFKKLLPDLPIILISGSSKNSLSHLKPGTIIISTHAAIYKKEFFKKSTGLLVVDEQHKFGVRQRSFLTDSLHPPHTLTMTATPIPRTVSLTLMGDLSLTTLESAPSGRPPVKTFLVPRPKINDCYRWLKRRIEDTREQAFIVCPFIEVSETMETVKSAKAVFDELKEIFGGLKLELIHGKIPPEKRERILKEFRDNRINILVSTPMIEVGIDFPNATTIIIQSADRFGLAQLHQLRGRVGRGGAQSFCYLFSESQNEKALNRLKFLSLHRDGQKIALYDLRTRGPGELYSVIQHGFPSLRLAKLTDYELISLGQKVISSLLDADPDFDFTRLLKDTPASFTATN